MFKVLKIRPHTPEHSCGRRLHPGSHKPQRYKGTTQKEALPSKACHCTQLAGAKKEPADDDAQGVVVSA